MIDLLDEDPRVAAARVALLAVRAALARTGPAPRNEFRLFQVRRTLGPETAALEMARIPPPVPLTGMVQDGVIVITRAEHRKWMRATPKKLAPKVARRRPREYPRLPVCCIGAGESLLVTMEAFEASEQDYPIDLEGYTADLPAVYLGDHPRTARQAYEAGAIRVVCFYFPEPSPEDTGDVIVLRIPGRRHRFRVLEHTRGAGSCALCGVGDAEWRETATWTRPWRVRRLCSACVGARIAQRALAKAREIDDWLNDLSPRGVRTLELEPEISHDLDRLEAPFHWLRMPAELREFLDRWRARLAE